MCSHLQILLTFWKASLTTYWRRNKGKVILNLKLHRNSSKWNKRFPMCLKSNKQHINTAVWGHFIEPFKEKTGQTNEHCLKKRPWSTQVFQPVLKLLRIFPVYKAPEGNMIHLKRKLNSDIQTAASTGTSQILPNAVLLDPHHEYKETKNSNDQQWQN